MQKMRQGDQFQTFLFFKKAEYEEKASGLQLILIYFDSPQIGRTIKTNCRLLTQRYAQF